MSFRGTAAWLGFVLVLGAGCNPDSPAPPAAGVTVIRATDLQADAALLRRAYQTLHPGLLRYNTPAQIDAAFGELQREFQQDRTLAQAYLAFSVFAAKVKCGHTYPNFFNQTESVAAELFQAPRLPFLFRWLGDRMIVTRSFTEDSRIRPGTEVLAINGVPVATILERLMTVARADGSNDAKRVAYLQVEGTSKYEAFDIYWPLFFPSSSRDVTLTVRGPAEQHAESITAARVSYNERLAAIEAIERSSVENNGPLWEYRMLQDGIGYLRMPTWALYNTDWHWEAFLNQTFTALVNSSAPDLVIDLRGNEGGNDVGSVLVSHLITNPVPTSAIKRFVRYRKIPDDLAPVLDTWDPSFKDWGSAAIASTDRFYSLRRDADDDVGAPIQPALPRFAGRVWVLVGATNSSATFEFAQLVQQNRLATLVGQPTGGNQRGINGGAFFFLRLPGSGIELDLPLIGQFRDGEWPDAGLQPEILVTPTVEQIAQGRDSELDAVRARIRKVVLEKPAE
jgi:C-terminal processing protease CtpA/Prc